MNTTDFLPRFLIRVLFYFAVLVAIFVLASFQLVERPGFVYQGF
jgi:hypothetical protein